MISVITPSHDPQWLDECWASLHAQTHADFEWIVLLNRGAQWTPPADERIKVHHQTRADSYRIGSLKAAACSLATGDVMVELDHDDLLTSDALASVQATFDERPDIGFVYSHFAQTDEAFNPQEPFDPAYGWTYRPVVKDGRALIQTDAPTPTPHNVSYIWYAPNHLRAWRSELYKRVGGHDPSLAVLDDQDLMARMFRETDFLLIEDCLYIQRAHGENTQARPDTNAGIQRQTVELYQRDIQPAALAWAARRNLIALDLGAAHGKPEGYLGVDQHSGPGVDFAGDVLTTLRSLANDSVGVIRAADFLEHVADSIALLNECHRVLAHGGMLLTLTPSTDGRGAFQDPTHVSFWNQNSFWYYTDADFAHFVPEITARFHVSYLDTHYPSDWHRDHDIPYVNANLVAVKPGGPRQYGQSGWAGEPAGTAPIA